MQMELGNAGEHRLSVEQVMDYTTPGISIELLIIMDLDSYGDFCVRWKSVKVFFKFHQVIVWSVGERRRI